jgi:hypothetical protein
MRSLIDKGNKMKNKLLSLAIATTFTGNVFATEMANLDTLPALETTEIQAAFQPDAQSLQLASLSGQEMKETEGAWVSALVFALVVPASISAWSYHGTSYYNTGSIGSSGGAASAAVLAAASSFFFGSGLAVMQNIGGFSALVLGAQGFAVNTSLQQTNSAYWTSSDPYENMPPPLVNGMIDYTLPGSYQYWCVMKLIGC